MSSKEHYDRQPHSRHERRHDSSGSTEPFHPSPLPHDLAAYLADKQLACLTMSSDQGTVLVVKAPRAEIDSARGTLPIQIRHELYAHPAAPVIRIATTIYDQPERPLAFETFINVGDAQQRSDYEGLANQDQLYLLFYDEGLDHRLTKAVGSPDPEEINHVLTQADALYAALPQDRFDFDRAKAEVIRATSL